MIDLITGLPGNSKTLFTISWVKQWAEKDNRPVFYSGIPELTLDWTEIDPEKWMECPPGAIVVVDECQRIFRNRSINSQAPKFVTDLETHRHLGIDLVFITQHPMLIDPAIRRLTGRHRHMVRIWGLDASTIHEWPAVRESCDKPASRKDSQKTKWVFDKSVYGLYKSAELHTGKRMIPKRIWWLVAAPVVVVLVVLFVRSKLFKEQKPTAAANPQNAAGAAAGPSSGRSESKPVDPVLDGKNFAFNNTPRVDGLPHTAPKYDEVTKPMTAPVPVACVSNERRCACYSQQGTVLDVTDSICREIVARGFFLDFDDKGGHPREKDERHMLGYTRSDSVPVQLAQSDGHVVAMGDIPVVRASEATRPRLGDREGMGEGMGEGKR
ncbi:Zonular occludens toxin [Herbaspirillum sp. HC18]|nr:Zonular occludens toxin [Herbaspirillum sp. HC18]